MTLSPLHLLLVCGKSIHLIVSMTLSSPPVAGVWWEHTLDCLYDSLLSTCSWCVVRAYTWLTLCSLLSTCSWCVVSAYTWLALWLSLLSTCCWCVVEHTLDCLYDSLSSPPVAGVWWEHTLDWLYALSSPPVAGVWWAHTLDWLYDSLSSPPVAGVWWEHTLDWLYALSYPPVAGVWWAHTFDWLYDSLSSPPVAGVWWAHTLDWLYDSLLSTCSWYVVRAYTWLSLWLSPLHL